MSYKIYAGTQTDVGVWDTKALIYEPAASVAAKTLISPTLTREAGKSGSLEFTVPLGNVAHSALQKLKTVVEVEQDGLPLWRGRVMSHDMDFLLRQKVYCEGELAYLNDTSVTPYQYKGISIKQFLSNVITNHNSQADAYKKFTLGKVTVTSAGVEKAFQVLYVRSCTIEDDDDRYILKDAGGLSLGYVSNEFYTLKIGESTVIKSGAAYMLTKTTVIRGKSYFTAMLRIAYSEEKFYELSRSESGGNYIYSLGDEATNWRMSETGRIQKHVLLVSTHPTYAWVTVANCSPVAFDVYNNEALDFGDGKNFGTTWDVLQSELTDVYGGYLTVRYSEDGLTRYLDYLTDDSLEQNTQTVEFGVNLLDLDNYVKAENVVTRVTAVGYQSSGWWIFKSTKTIQATASDPQAEARYGKITRVIVIDGKSSTTQSLLDEAEEELKKHLRYVDGIEVSAVDLRDAGVEVERMGWMKKTHVISAPHGLDTWLPCTKVVEPLDVPDKKKFTFGTSFYSISDLQALSSQKASAAYSMALSTAGYINNVK